MDVVAVIVLSFLFLPSSIIILGIFWYGLLWPVLTKEGRATRIREKEEQGKRAAAIEKSRRVEMIDGVAWEVVIVPTSVLQNKKTQRIAALMEYGMKSWIHIQPLKKDRTIGKAKPHWTHSSNWEVVGTIGLKKLDRKCKPQRTIGLPLS